MILLWFILILLTGGLLAWLVGRWNRLWARGISLGALGVDLLLGLILWLQRPSEVTFATQGAWWL
jgi:NADH-quinone oxidoreductase subunit M